ncbi:MAG: hypothetical protein QOH61_96 [Chloroflexota bacterium]|jgi:hypothetical protein|nr:hypothetical protein [Chloroflexota bacterium]
MTRRTRLVRAARGTLKDLAAASPTHLPGRIAEARALAEIRRSGLFDEGFYRSAYPDVAASGVDPLSHYVRHGAAEGRRPNPLFDARYYAARYPGVAARGTGPFLDFIRNGARRQRSPHRWFDTGYYLHHAGTLEPGVNPLSHYLRTGAGLGLDPHPDFDSAWYVARHPDAAEEGVNPLVHFVTREGTGSVRPNARAEADHVAAEGGASASPISIAQSASRDPSVPVDHPGTAIGRRRVRLVAFYLPQFHPIPENDRWWGAGFTEWTHVARARPLYDGHPQPRLPTDLGFYDLRVPETREAQAALARGYGIDAFCYYFYWFNGRRLLERPLNEMLASGRPDLPFCICWANENWTRRWDGLDQEVLVGQSYSVESNRRFIRDVIPILEDPRYVRHGGRPVLIVYRVRHLPDVAETIEMWRRECRAAGIGEIHVAGVRFWDVVNVQELGFDAAIDFPPHQIAVRDVSRKVKGLDRDFSGLIYDYGHAVRTNLETRGHGYDQPAHRGVMLAWDNTPRLGTAAHIGHGATPELYGQWLRGILDQEMRHNPEPESLIFVNAWNEWGEGANLEPDTHFGYGFLEATRSALAETAAAWATEAAPATAGQSVR